MKQDCVGNGLNSSKVCIDLFHIYGVQQIIENNMWEYQTRRRGLGAVVCGLC